MSDVHTHDSVPLPRLGARVAGWGNPYVWEFSHRDYQWGSEDYERPLDWPAGSLIFRTSLCETEVD